MSIQLNMLQSIQPQQSFLKPTNEATSSTSFADTLKGALNDVNQAQLASEKKTEMLVNGEIDDLHDVMITAQKASVSLNLAVQVQGKVIDAYNEMMRMQI